MKIYQSTWFSTGFVSALLFSFAGFAVAQETESGATDDAAQDDEAVVEEIVVKGYRGSLQRAIERKRLSDELMDNVSAQDIGELAAENIGDALFSLPGVDVDFDNGEADNIIVGGLPAEYTQVTVDGAGLQSMNTSQEGAVSAAGFSTTIVAGVDVIKSPSARRNEGALGGVVNLRSWKPLNFREPKIKLSGTYGYQDKTGENDGKLNALFGMRNDSRTFGFVIGGASEARQFRQDNFATAAGSIWLYNLEGGSSTNRNAAEELSLMHRSIEYRENTFDYQRDNVVMGLQFRPADNLDVSLNATYTNMSRQRDQSQNSARFGQNRWYDPDYLVTQEAAWDGDARVSQMVLGGVLIGDADGNSGSFERLQAFRFYRTGENKIGNMEVNWDPSDDLNVKFKFSHSENSTETLASENGHTTFSTRGNYLYGMGDAGLPFFYRLNDDANDGNNFNAELYPDFDPADPATWSGVVVEGGADLDAYLFDGSTPSNRYNDATGEFAALDFTYRNRGDFIKSVNFGARLSNSEIQFRSTNGLAPPNAWIKNDGENTYTLADVGVARTITEGDDFLSGDANGWRVPDWTAARSAIYNGAGDWLGTNITGPQPFLAVDDQHFGETDTFAAYLQFNFASSRWRGNFGLRYVADDYLATSWQRKSDLDLDGLVLAGSPWIALRADGSYADPQGDETNAKYNPLRRYNPRNNQRKHIAQAFWDQDMADRLEDPDNFDERTGGLVETHLLPSLNTRFELTEDMFLRFSASQTMARQPFNQRKATTTFSVQDNDEELGEVDVYTLRGGNPEMKATTSTNFNLGWEWYVSDTTFLSVAYLRKDLKNVRSVLRKVHTDVDFVDPVTGELYEGIDVVERRADGNGYGDLYNIEVSLIQGLGWLPGRFFDNMGYNVNYTYSERNVVRPTDDGVQPLAGPPKNSYNLQLYYQGERFLMRLAHFWRDDRVARTNSNDAKLVETWQGVRRNSTLTTRYSINDNFDIGLRVQNLFDDRPDFYGAGYPVLITNIAETGRRYMLDLNYTF